VVRPVAADGSSRAARAVSSASTLLTTSGSLPRPRCHPRPAEAALPDRGVDRSATDESVGRDRCQRKALRADLAVKLRERGAMAVDITPMAAHGRNVSHGGIPVSLERPAVTHVDTRCRR
jgi:hypothetical protein